MTTLLRTVNNTSGIPEYVLLPISVYQSLKQDIDTMIKQARPREDYVVFNPEDFIKNRLALSRMQAKITQTELARVLHVSQAYISKIENDEYPVTEKLFAKINRAIQSLKRGNRPGNRP